MTDSQANSQPLSKDDEEMIEAIFSDLNPKNHPDLSDIFLVRKQLRRYRTKNPFVEVCEQILINIFLIGIK